MKNYTKKAKILPCRLRKDDLLDLIRIVQDTFPSSDRKEDFEISTNLKNISIYENSIEDFLKHKELPEKFNRLSFRIMGWSKDQEIGKRKIAKGVRMVFFDNFIDLDVDGIDQTWVLGKYTQIKEFLSKKKPWFWVLNKIFPYIAGVVPFLAFFALIEFIKTNEIIYSTTTAIFLIAFMLAIIFYFEGTFLPYAQIIIRSKDSFLNKEKFILIVMVLSLIISIIGGIIIPLTK
jgi:hypothetical protein